MEGFLKSLIKLMENIEAMLDSIFASLFGDAFNDESEKK